MLGIIFAAGGAGERNGLIADDARAAIHRSRIDAPIHDVDRSGLQHRDIERFDVAQLAVRDVDEAGNVAAVSIPHPACWIVDCLLLVQVQQRMHLHRRFGGARQRPRKKRQT